MKRKTMLVLAATLAAVCAAAIAAAISSGGTAAGPALVFTARDEPGNFALADLGARSRQGPDIGDVLALTQTLFAAGKQAGVVHLAAIGVDHRRRLTQATGTVVLANGTIAFAGLVPQSPRFSLAVLGGTGRYAGVHGTLTVSTPKRASTIALVVEP